MNRGTEREGGGQRRGLGEWSSALKLPHPHPLSAKVERNMKANFHPSALKERRAERAAANASIAILSQCIALADARVVEHH